MEERSSFSKYAYGIVPVRYAFVNVAASSTDAAVASAISGKKLRVLAVVFVCGAVATTATFNSKGSGAGTAISAQFQNAANGGAVLPHISVGWFETVSGEALTLTTGAGSTTGVQVVYVEY